MPRSVRGDPKREIQWHSEETARVHHARNVQESRARVAAAKAARDAELAEARGLLDAKRAADAIACKGGKAAAQERCNEDRAATTELGKTARRAIRARARDAEHEERAFRREVKPAPVKRGDDRRWGRRRKKKKGRRGERAAESDSLAAHNIPPELRAAWEENKARYPRSWAPDRRAEAFLEDVETSPELARRADYSDDYFEQELRRAAAIDDVPF